MNEPTKVGSEKLAAKLKQLRGEMTQEQAAAKAGVSMSTWQNIELQKFRAAPITLRRISEGFGVNIDDLRDLTDDSAVIQRFSDEELQRLAERLAPALALELVRLREPKQ